MSLDLKRHLRTSGYFFAGLLASVLTIAALAPHTGAPGFFLLIVGMPAAFLALILGSCIYFADGIRAAQGMDRAVDRVCSVLAVPTFAAISFSLGAPASLAAARALAFGP